MFFSKSFTGAANRTDKRRDTHPVAPALEVTIDGSLYPTVDWSLAGVVLSNYFGPLAPGDEVTGSLQVLRDLSTHPFKAVVVRRDAISGQLALDFTDIGKAAFAALEAMKMSQIGL